MTIGFVLGIAAFSALVLILAGWLMLRVSDTDDVIAMRFEAAHGRWLAPEESAAKAGKSVIDGVQRGLLELGRLVMHSGILPGRTRDELAQTLRSAGFRGANTLPLFIGSKLAMLFGLPLAGWLLSKDLALGQATSLLLIGGGAIAGLLAPDTVIKKMRTRHLAKIDKGLSDALDLMVICCQAGLSLEPAMGRVSVELRSVHPAMCQELEMTVRELEMMSDSSHALLNLGERTGLEGLIRLTSTLVQTLQYGTPLSESLRTLSNEMRQAALTQFEERAARLPVMLTMPMIGFILPTVFIIVGGPAAIQIMHSFSN